MISLYGNSINEFKTSNYWISAFMKRYNLSWWQHTKVSQKLPSQTDELLKNFQEFIIRLRTEKLFEMSNILNMDETPVCICQPLDVTISKPFKDNLRKEWHIWMAGGGVRMTASGNFHRVRLSDVCEWVKHSWDRIPDEMVIKSFKTCRISTSLDGSDDEITDNED
ncbi:pogo transposable element with KRAB domain [Rhizophagus clarus]|uniref:Pogo transposable element with KRAB domain n=1 Tax=Rhizophagus clarus TaxID=94130 RepID=A0A8H3KV68_9GLOM|nr:pogo transposable element with KRAB domain [Rhizophagus clarus]